MSADDTIALIPYTSMWPIEAAAEINRIKDVIPSIQILHIEHIGSTSVPGCRAKPIIDIAVEVRSILDGMPAVQALERLNYKFWSENPDKNHLFFVKGMPPYGTGRTHHVHFFKSERFAEHIKFRELLKSSPLVLQEYQDLKTRLAVEHKHDRETYTKLKGRFIDKALRDF